MDHMAWKQVMVADKHGVVRPALWNQPCQDQMQPSVWAPIIHNGAMDVTGVSFACAWNGLLCLLCVWQVVGFLSPWGMSECQVLARYLVIQKDAASAFGACGMSLCVRGSFVWRAVMSLLTFLCINGILARFVI